jgi:hypothetical protein
LWSVTERSLLGTGPSTIEVLEEEIITKSMDGFVKSTVEEAKKLLPGYESFISEWKDFPVFAV